MRGYVRKRGNKWSYTVDIGRDPITGKRKQKTKSGFKTEKEAEAALTEIIYEVNKGIWIEPNKVTVSEFALEWFDSHKHTLRKTTAEQYEAKIKKWIIPLIGNLKVQDVKPIHAQTYSKQLLNNMQQSTAHKVYSIAKMIFFYAVNLELMPNNPLAKVSIIKDTKKRVKTWKFDELSRFLKVVKKYDKFYYRVFAFAAYTGMRKGEVLGLKKSDIDFNDMKISVKHSLSETKEEGVQIGDLKTPSSYRAVAIDNFISTILKEQININNEMKLKLGKEYRDNDLVFCHEDGMVYRPTSLNRPFKKYIEIAGLPKIRFHDLRHTHATLMLELNVNPKIVADRLGHSTVKITLDTYTHTSLEIQQNVADLFAEKVKKA